MESMHPDVQGILLSEKDIHDVVSRMGAEISRDYADKNPLVVAVLRGAVVFMADLMRAIDCPMAIDFMAVSSYGEGAKSSGVVRIVKDLDTKIEGRNVLIVEDILDSGLTLSYLMRMLSKPVLHRGRGVPCEGRAGQPSCRHAALRGRPRA